ncbi:MAG: 50S ribosomal protein L3 N(5)-glutamine methyltransferase [Rubrivivax sp.]|jgi:ribosomal protein L3 glutamine methyltransferase|nr:50S ribosomal protein L3 N(5)-glutamine methyltransferase [Rubrivivax sp.]
MRLIEVVERCAARLDAAGVAFGHGTQNAFDEAAWLVLWACGRPLDALDDSAEHTLSAGECTAIESLLERRIHERQPLAYLTGEAWLQGLPFHIDRRAIVPRSLVAETLAEGLIDAWLGREPARVLDLCTGNGSLAVLAALAWRESRGVASDLSTDALAVATQNLARHGVADRVVLRQGDGLAALQPGDGPFDLILCNPPYVNTASMQALPAEFRAEPALALAGGTDGMDFIRPLMANAALWLTETGVLVLEIGHERAHFDAAFPTLDAVWLPTSPGDDQVLLLSREALMETPR